MYERLRATRRWQRDVQWYGMRSDLPGQSAAKLQRNLYRAECGVQWDVPQWPAHVSRWKHVHRGCLACVLLSLRMHHERTAYSGNLHQQCLWLYVRQHDFAVRNKLRG